MKGRKLPLGGTGRKGGAEDEKSASAAAATKRSNTKAPASASGAEVTVTSSRPQRLASKTNNSLASEGGSKLNRISRSLPISSKSSSKSAPSEAKETTPQSSGKASKHEKADSKTKSGTKNSSHAPSSSKVAMKKRMSDTSDVNSARIKCYEVLPTLDAVTRDGSHITVRLMIDGHHYAPVRDTNDSHIHDSSAIGQDGNRFYCQVCKGFGEIVCCDGCPRVYHPHCIPENSPSRRSLEQDDDPWFCPECLSGKNKSKSFSSRKKRKKGSDSHNSKKKEAGTSSKNATNSRARTTSQHRCVDCQKTRADLQLEPCEACGNYVHHPSCKDEGIRSSGVVYCSTCRAVDELTKEEDEAIRKSDSVGGKRGKSRGKDGKGNGGQKGDNGDDDHTAEMDVSHDASASTPTAGEKGEGGTTPATSSSRKKRKRKRQGGSTQTDSASKDPDKNGSEKKQKKIKKMKKQKKSLDSKEAPAPVPVSTDVPPKRSPSPTNSARATSPVENSQSSQQDMEQGPPNIDDEPNPYPARNQITGLAQATPAFYFYLVENRWKIERALARNHRYFNRLPKSAERNELVAKEAASWWSKLRPADHRRYMNMSMRDFESRIISWKEDKNLQELGLADVEPSEPSEDAEPVDDSAEDDRLTYERHERLYLNTSVGSKPFKPESDQSYNRVLLDLLHDMRFHPLPMFSVNRSETETVIDDHNAKVTIPHFEVHGPISTSVGDECLGCTRGWIHFCPVLQRRVPAVEHRAKLQPPLSSWSATRIGLGLRPRLERTEEPFDQKFRFSRPDVFEWRSSEETIEMKNLPVLPSSTLSHPSDRADDICNFIEETMAMKVPEPPRPSPPPVPQAPSSPATPLSRKTLPTQKLKEATANATAAAPMNGQETISEDSVYKCGRCRTIIYNDTGCVQCRRAQLVINTTKRAPTNPERSGNLKLRTVMLGRVQIKDGQTEPQTESDIAVSNAILKERWSPSAILPPTGSHVPGGCQPEEDEMEEDETSVPVDMEVDDDEHDKTVNEEEGVLENGTEEEMSQENDRSRRPQRSARIASTSATTGEIASLDRDNFMRENKKKADELHRKALSIACCGILLALKRRDPLLLFAEPATAEGYSAVVKTPIDLGKIRSDVLAEKYSSLGSFMGDARLLCENALAFNPAGSIYSKTAKELRDLLGLMQKRANNWMGAIMDAYTGFLFDEELRNRKSGNENALDDASESGDPFESLRSKWPQAVDMLENGDWLKKQLEADFMRTQENETAYYGSLAVRRVSTAAEASLAPYTDAGGIHSVVSRRTDVQDEALRHLIDDKVSSMPGPLLLKDISTWREESVVRLLRKVQSRRLDRRSASENGCSRCDSLESIRQSMKASNVDFAHPGRAKRKGEGDLPRVDSSRTYLTTGLGSAMTCRKIVQRKEEGSNDSEETIHEVCVSVRGSKIHGWGMFADQPFKKGDIVAEYVGEYVVNAVADAREKIYQEQRIQDYQFRLDDKLVIDATMRGGHGRYINHNCSPNCYAKIVNGKEPKPYLKRVLIVAQRAIEINEEISYDYQFPLELNLANRIPCNCQSEACRGFMNWDIPEKGSNNRALLVQKRGANMRDRIRRLGRPLKRDEV